MTKNVAFYGSLRKGCYNYERFKDGLTEKGQSVISGFRLYSLGAYPCIIRSDNPEDKVVVDLFEADEATFNRIHRMELGAGYDAEEVELNNENYVIYTFPPSMSEFYTRNRVSDGDWLKHVQDVHAKYAER